MSQPDNGPLRAKDYFLIDISLANALPEAGCTVGNTRTKKPKAVAQ